MTLGSTEPLTEMITRHFPEGKALQMPSADNLTGIGEPIVYKIWEPQCLRTFWVSTARYKDSFTFLLDSSLYGRIILK
jgi:hypothetical protein